MIVRLDVPLEARIALLVEQYAGLAALPCGPGCGASGCRDAAGVRCQRGVWLEQMEASTAKLQKRLGGDRVRQVTEYLHEADYASFAEVRVYGGSGHAPLHRREYLHLRV